MADEPPSPSSEEEYFDAVDDTAPRADDAPVVTAELVDGEDALAAQMRRLEAHSNASLCATASTASTAELPVETHGMPCGPNGCTRAEGEEEGHRVPCLSRYRVSAGSVHPLADLAPSLSALFIGGAEQEDSLSEMHTESLSCGSRSSLGAHSVALSLRPAEDGAAEQPKKVRVRAKRKSRAEFSRLLLVQELDPAPAPDDADASASSAGAAPQKPLFTVKFNHDGNFLAAAGEDGVVRVWKLLVDDVAAAGGEHEGYAPPRMGSIFQQHPLQHFCGHQGAVLDLSWSRNNFLLSASMDQTVRLWHCSRPDCLGVFRHPDFVTSVAFHPRDDRIFITGSLDCRLRLWSIAERSVKAWNELPPNNFVTAVAFTTSGRYALAGTTTGVCLLFETEGFNYSTQIHVHSRRGKNKIGKKICGIEPMPGRSSDELILISTNDSRIRLYTLRDKSVISKFIGHKNTSSQIRASFSDDGEYVISGSEDSRVFVWNVENLYRRRSLFFAHRPSQHVDACEFFESHSKPTTCAVFAPSAVRNRLQSVGLRPVLAGEMCEGQIIVAVDLGGHIKVYENSSVLEGWLLGSEKTP